MRNYAQVFTAIWRDDDFKALDRNHQHAYLLLVTQPDISAAGVLPLTTGRWARLAADATRADLRRDLERLDAGRFIVVDEDTEEVLVRSFVRHDNGYANPRRQPSIRDAARAIESPRLREVLAAEFARLGLPAWWLGEGADDAETAPDDPGECPDADDTPETEFPQVNSHSDRQTDIDGMANRFQTARTTTHNPQPTTHNPAAPASPSPAPAAAGTPTPPAPRQPSIVTPRWLAADVHTPAPAPVNPTRPTTAPLSLFTKPTGRLTERQQIVMDWLRGNDFPDAADQDARDIDKLVRQQYPSSTPAYLRGMAKPDGSGFGGYYQQARRVRGEATEATIKALQNTEPACEHGTPAGRAPHPTHGDPLCGLCRKGVPAPADTTTGTHPDTAAALDAYRAAAGRALHTADLLAVTQQADALRLAGVPATQLADLARTAAATGVGLLTAARKDHR